VNLYELTGEVAELERKLNSADSDEELNDLLNQLELSEEKLAQKLDNYGKLIQNKLASHEQRMKEADRLAALAQTDKNLADRLKERLRDCLTALGETRVETPSFKFSVCQNGGSQPLDVSNDAELPEDCYQIQRRPDMSRIRERLAAGESLDGVTVRDRGQHLRIK
jgi:chromosome segregation ATPase